jgi:solute carrier family 34 (sodium-dependent phosphate cotransporter)
MTVRKVLNIDEGKQTSAKHLYRNIGYVLITIFIFLLSINMMGQAFNQLTETAAQSILAATSDPFVGLFIGLLITALIQSSSSSTTMIVAAVAVGSISFEDAVPIIMGANIGTTITSSIVSLGYITKRNEFRKAIAAGAVHDIFNILTTIILFPLELKYHLLSRLSREIASSLSAGDLFSKSGPIFNINTLLFDPISHWVSLWISQPIILLTLSFLVLIGCIKLLSTIIYKRLIGQSKVNFENIVFNNPLKAFGWGTLLTAAIQSSSITTSLIVPLAATRKISVQKAFNFILGANVGTTITAIIAALFKSEEAIAVAIAHLLFNLIGVLIFLPFPVIRRIPVKMAELLGKFTLRYRIVGFAYILLTFFIIPYSLILAHRSFTQTASPPVELIDKKPVEEP